MTQAKNVNLKLIRIDGGTQARAKLCQETVQEYRTALHDGDEFPPVVLIFDGSNHWLADGFHRYHAYSGEGRASIPAHVVNGTVRDAIHWAASSNKEHGLRRSNEDKRRAVQMLLADEEWCQWSDRQIAEHCGVSHTFVSTVRSSLATVASEDRTARTYKTKHGTLATMDVSAIGKRTAAKAATRNAEVGKDERNPITEAPASSLSAVNSQPLGAPTLEDAHGDFDPIAELEKAQREIAELMALIAAAEADDLKAEAIRWRKAYDHATRSQGEAMERASQTQKREEWTMRQLRRCGKAIGEEDPAKIAAAVEAFVRQYRKAA